MPVSLKFQILGEQQLDRTLLDIEDRGEDMSPAFEVLRARFLKLEERQFATEGAAGGRKWAPLSESYAEWKSRHYPGQPILRRTDDLWRSLTVGPAINIITRDAARFGTDVEYAGFHQQPSGTRRTGIGNAGEATGSLPRRPPVVITSRERDQWVKVLQSYLVTGTVTGVSAP